MIVNDRELHDIYETSALVRRAVVPEPQIDIEKEWRQFHRHLAPRRPSWHIAISVAAIFTGIIFLSSVLVTTLTCEPSGDSNPVTADAESPATYTELTAHEAPHATMNAVAQPPAPQSKKKTTAKPKRRLIAAAGATKTQAQPSEEENIDVDEYLRIQQAKIDNQLATQKAQIIEYEYNAMLDMYYPDAIDTPDRDIHAKTISNLTMQ